MAVSEDVNCFNLERITLRNKNKTRRTENTHTITKLKKQNKKGKLFFHILKPHLNKKKKNLSHMKTAKDIKS